MTHEELFTSIINSIPQNQLLCTTYNMNKMSVSDFHICKDKLRKLSHCDYIIQLAIKD